MAYDEKTKNVGLPQWKANDKPERKDFNEAFAMVDTELSKKMNRGRPTQYPLQLLEGYKYSLAGGNNTYSRDENGFVIIHFSVIRENEGAFPTKVSDFAAIPEGFLPKQNIHGFAAWSDRVGVTGTPITLGALRAYIVPGDKVIRYNTAIETVKQIDGFLCYYAFS